MAPAPEDDPWADKPDPWAERDREWERAGRDPAGPDDGSGDIEPPGEGYVGQDATLGGVADSYQEGMREAGPYLGLGIQIAGAMGLFVGGGIALDRALGWTPWGVIGGAVLGFVAVLALVVRLANEASGKTKEASKRN